MEICCYSGVSGLLILVFVEAPANVEGPDEPAASADPRL